MRRAPQPRRLCLAVSGSGGLVGSALVRSLEHGGHRVVRLVRGESAAGRDEVRWDPASRTIDAEGLRGLDGVPACRVPVQVAPVGFRGAPFLAEVLLCLGEPEERFGIAGLGSLAKMSDGHLVTASLQGGLAERDPCAGRAGARLWYPGV